MKNQLVSVMETLWNWTFKYCLEEIYTVNRTAGAMQDNFSCLVTIFFNKVSFLSWSKH